MNVLMRMDTGYMGSSVAGLRIISRSSREIGQTGIARGLFLAAKEEQTHDSNAVYPLEPAIAGSCALDMPVVCEMDMTVPAVLSRE